MLQVTSDTFDAVIVCSGREAWPHRVTFEGQHHFKGRIIHNQQYRRPEPFTDMTVVIVGFAYSACDTASDLSNTCKEVSTDLSINLL
jgi:dimethylaniline monooxygenase (N-oxide forming)